MDNDFAADTLEQIRRQLKNATDRYALIQERIGEFVLAEEVPLQLTKNKRTVSKEIEQLRASLQAAENRQVNQIAARVFTGGRALLEPLGPTSQLRQQLGRLLKALLQNLNLLTTARDDQAVQRASFVAALDQASQRLTGRSFGALCGLQDALLREPLAGMSIVIEHGARSGDEQVQSRSVRSGIDALIDLTHDVRVREIVASFNADFEQAREGVRKLIFYKDLHDQLHTLQYRCYNPLLRDQRAFPNDALVLESFCDYEMTIGEILRSLHEIIEQAVPPVSPPDWFSDLEAAVDGLRVAIEQRDQRTLQTVILRLDRVLSTQPFFINGSLIATAHTLPLPGLIATMRELWRYLVGLDLDQAKLARYEEGITALAEISRGFTQLLNEHHAWQTIEQHLRRLEVSLRQDTIELELFWGDIKAKAQLLCAASLAEWAVTLTRDAARLDAALADRDLARIKEAFLRFRRQSSDRFFRVDTNLKRQCDRLREFGDPFAKLLRVTENQRAYGL